MIASGQSAGGSYTISQYVSVQGNTTTTTTTTTMTNGDYSIYTCGKLQMFVLLWFIVVWAITLRLHSMTQVMLLIHRKLHLFCDI